MTLPRRTRTGAAIVVALSLLGIAPVAAQAAAAPASAATAPPAATAPTSEAKTEINYLADVYPALPEDHVLESATYERLVKILELTTGENFAIVFGGSENASSQAAVGYIDEAAKAAGVTKVYHFDPRLDGDPRGRLDITRTDTGLAQTWRQLWSVAAGTGVKDYVSNIDPAYTSSSTYLFVYNRSHVTSTGAKAPVVAGALSTATSFDATSAAAYKTQLAAVFDSVKDPTTGKADIAEYPFFDYYQTRINNVAATKAAGVGIPDSAREGFTIETITYPELIHLLQTDGDFTILFGGTWCPYTTPTANIADSAAKRQGVKKIYQFDFRLDGNSSARHIRDSGNGFSYLYGNIINTYLTNLELEPLDNGGITPIKYYPDGDTAQSQLTAKTIGVPFFFEYDKNNLTKAGAPAPVANEWIGYAPGKGKYFAYAWYQASDVRKYTDDPTYYVKQLGRPVDPDVDSVTKSTDGDRSVSLALPALDTFFSEVTTHREAAVDVWDDVPTGTVSDDSTPSDTGGCGTGDSAIDPVRQDPILGQNGNQGYDVDHYDVNLAYTEPVGSVLAGALKATTTVTATATSALSSISFDFRRLSISAITVDGVAAASYTQQDDDTTDTHKLVIVPATSIEKDATFTVTVTYRSFTDDYQFADGSTQGFVPSGNSTGATAIGEPNGPTFWFPSNNNTTDRATYDLTLTAPSNLTGVSVGVLTSTEVRGTTTTRHWQETEPTLPYAVFVSFGDYVELAQDITLTDGTVLPTWSYVDRTLYNLNPDVRAKVYDYAKNLQQTVRWAETVAGRYPGTSAGFVFENLSDGVNDVTWNLETQGRPVFAGVPQVQTFVHEYLHQWFGNSLTIAGWEDLWLNEGLAVYFTNYYLETHGAASGTATDWYSEWFEANDDARFWGLAPADPLNTHNLFGTGVYGKASHAVAALRVALGERDFFTVFERWAQEHAGQSVSTAEFVAFAGQVADVDLAPFAQTWLYGTTKPAAFPTAPLRKLSDPLPSVPGVLAPPVATVSGTSVTVTWTGSEDASVTGYVVALSNGTTATTDAQARSRSFSGLAAGTYSATVAAVNEAGTGEASPRSATVTVAATKPSGPEPTTRPTATRLTLSSASKVSFGSGATLTVTASTATATGKVTATIGTKVVATGTLKAGKATLKIAASHLKPGKRKVTITYAGDTEHLLATSSTTLTVARAKAKVTVKTSKKKVARGTKVSVTVRVTVPKGASPRGKVTLYDGTRKVTTVTLPGSGKKTVKVRLSKKSGRHTVRARYAGSTSTAAASATAKVTAR